MINFLPIFLADQAKAAGLDVFVSQDTNGFEPQSLRISTGQQHLIVKVFWNGNADEIISARFTDAESNVTTIPGLDHVDNFTNARQFALLGWVVSHIQFLAEEKARHAEWAA